MLGDDLPHAQHQNQPAYMQQYQDPQQRRRILLPTAQLISGETVRFPSRECAQTHIG